MKGAISLLLLPLLAVATPLHKTTEIAPLVASDSGEHIPDSYIVKFKKHVTHSQAAEHHSWVDDVHVKSNKRKRDLQTAVLDDIFTGLKHTYNIGGSLLGYSGHFDEEVLEEIRRHPDVEIVERDQIVHTLEHKHDHEDPEIEKNAPWGLARISHRKPLSFGTYNKYLYAADGGEGVDIYIIDTGTNVDHVDFEERARWGKTIPNNDEDADRNGHGTHCSGIAAGKKYGVAKKANVIAVKVLRSNGSGTLSDVLKGMEWVVDAHMERVEAAKDGKDKKPFKGSTANMSLGGGKSVILNQAADAAVDAGIHLAVAAGNENQDACKSSPAGADKVVTVGASTFSDERAYFSNYGKCTDIFAPGLNILSTWIGSKYATNTISGTSMASPYVAGLLAYLLSLQPDQNSAYSVGQMTPAELKANLLGIATQDALTLLTADSPNLLAWNGGGVADLNTILKESQAKHIDDMPTSEHIVKPEMPCHKASHQSLTDRFQDIGRTHGNVKTAVKHMMDRIMGNVYDRSS